MARYYKKRKKPNYSKTGCTLYEKDEVVLELKRKAEADYRDLGNELGISPGCASQRTLGFLMWQPGERERVIRFLEQRIERQKAEAKHAGTGTHVNTCALG